MPKYEKYRSNGSAAYDIRTNTAQPAQRPDRLPEAPQRVKPARKVKTKLAIAPFTVIGTAVVVVMLFRRGIVGEIAARLKRPA